jgi:methionine aminopeptidase
MNRKLARRVAKSHGVSVREVREGCQEAINHAYKKTNFYAGQVPHVGTTPTVDEFIAHAVREAKARVGT